MTALTNSTVNSTPATATGPLLEAGEEISLPATTAPFDVKAMFKTGNGVRFSTIWEDFQTHFFGHTEAPMPALTIRKYKLLRIAPDAPIIAELGGIAKVETPLAAAFAILLRQPAGQPGLLQTSGFANIFYTKDKNGVLCAIRIGLASDGWVVDAIPVADPLAWNGKHEIFCPVA